MAVGFVQGTFLEGTSSTLTIVKAFASNVTAGDLLFAYVFTPTAVGGSITFTDSQGNAYSTNSSDTVGSFKIVRSEAIAGSTGACTVTVTFQFAQSFPELWIGEFNIGGHAIARDAADATGSDSGTSFNSASITTTNNPDVVICAYANNGSLSGLTAGWTQNVIDSANGGFASIVVTTPAAYSLTATQPAGGDGISVMFSYKATATGTTLDPGPITGTMHSSGVVTPRLIGTRFVQANNQDVSTSGAGNTASLAYASNVAAGDLLLFIASTGSVGNPQINALSDTVGSSWTQYGLPYDAIGGRIHIWYAVANASGANTVTVGFNIAQVFDLLLLEYSGILTPVVTDGETDNNAASNTSITSGNLATTKAPDLLIFACSCGSQPTGLSTGWTQRLWDAGNGDTVADNFLSSTGTYSYSATQTTGGFLGRLIAFQARSSGTLRPGPLTGTMKSTGVVIPRIPIRIQISGAMVSSGVVHGTIKPTYVMLSSGVITVHTVKRAPVSGTMLSSGIVVPRLIGTVFPMSKGFMTSSGVVTLRLQPLRKPITGTMQSSGVVQPRLGGIVRPTALGTMTSSGMVHPELVLRPAATGMIAGIMRSSGGQTNPRTVTRAPVSGSSTSSGVVTVRLRTSPTAIGTMVSSGVVTPRLIGTVFPTAFGTMQSSGIVTVQLQPLRPALVFRTMRSSGAVNVNLVTPIKPPIIVTATGYYAVIDTWGGKTWLFP